MKDISTFAFLLRWYFGRFLVGLALTAMGGLGLWVLEPDPPELPHQSLAGPFVEPLMWVLLLVGIGLVVDAWRAASTLRSGRP